MEFIENESGIKLKEKKGDTVDFLNSTSWTASAKISFSNGLVMIDASCGGLGPVQNKHVNEFAEIIKSLIERSINEDVLNQTSKTDSIRCPKCGSTQIQLKNADGDFSVPLINTPLLNLMKQRLYISRIYRTIERTLTMKGVLKS